MNPRLFLFVGGSEGDWKVASQTAIRGQDLAPIEFMSIVSSFETGPVRQAVGLAPGSQAAPDHVAWILRGVTSHHRYTLHAESEELEKVSVPLGRETAVCAAMIAIRKSDAWWNLAQDERRAILEEQSHHIQIGLEYTPQVARRLHHCRDLESNEPFDFLTLFDFEPEYTPRFDEMVQRLRATPEWTYVEREVDFRLSRGAIR